MGVYGLAGLAGEAAGHASPEASFAPVWRYAAGNA